LKKVKEIQQLCTGVLEYGEHIIVKIDTKISQKGRFRLETNLQNIKEYQQQFNLQ